MGSNSQLTQTHFFPLPHAASPLVRQKGLHCLYPPQPGGLQPAHDHQSSALTLPGSTPRNPREAGQPPGRCHLFALQHIQGFTSHCLGHTKQPHPKAPPDPSPCRSEHTACGTAAPRAKQDAHLTPCQGVQPRISLLWFPESSRDFPSTAQSSLVGRSPGQGSSRSSNSSRQPFLREATDTGSSSKEASAASPCCRPAARHCPLQSLRAPLSAAATGMCHHCGQALPRA